MTHPLTPREKVARTVYDTVTRFDGDTVGTHLGLSAMIDAAAPTVDDERRIVKSVCDDIADSVLTALASGSGDHEELARLAEAAEHDPEYDGRSFEAAANPATVLALLAENAALRAANTEAERKLAEAVGLLREAVEPYEHISNVRAFEVMENGLATRLVAIRAFLSKEAERG